MKEEDKIWFNGVYPYFRMQKEINNLLILLKKFNTDMEEQEDNFISEFIEELKNALENTINKKQNRKEENNVIDEYNRYERKKIFLDNKSKKGNDFAWVMDENSVCISEHGDGGPFFINEIDLPNNAKVGEVYEKVNGEYVYNSEITIQLKKII